MTMFLNILFLIIGLVLLIKGADFFVMSSSAIARKLKVSTLFIGLTIVSIGTSLPELSISIVSAIKKSIDLSVGNIVGSNLFNMFLILGIISLIRPIPIEKSTKKLDFPFLICITGLLLLFCADSILDGNGFNVVSRSESIVLLLILILYMAILIYNAKHKNAPTFENMILENKQNADDEFGNTPEMKNWKIILFLILGIAGIVFGAECVSTTAQYIAIQLGMSEALVGLTIVALGTSLPELATSVVATRKGENDLALGNIIGSSIANIGLILGTVGVISKIDVSNLILVDVTILFVFTAILAFLCYPKKEISKLHGVILIGMYVAYLTFAIVRNYCF